MVDHPSEPLPTKRRQKAKDRLRGVTAKIRGALDGVMEYKIAIDKGHELLKGLPQDFPTHLAQKEHILTALKRIEETQLLREEGEPEEEQELEDMRTLVRGEETEQVADDVSEILKRFRFEANPAMEAVDQIGKEYELLGIFTTNVMEKLEDHIQEGKEITDVKQLKNIQQRLEEFVTHHKAVLKVKDETIEEMLGDFRQHVEEVSQQEAQRNEEAALREEAEEGPQEEAEQIEEVKQLSPLQLVKQALRRKLDEDMESFETRDADVFLRDEIVDQIMEDQRWNKANNITQFVELQKEAQRIILEIQERIKKAREKA